MVVDYVGERNTNDDDDDEGASCLRKRRRPCEDGVIVDESMPLAVSTRSHPIEPMTTTRSSSSSSSLVVIIE